MIDYFDFEKSIENDPSLHVVLNSAEKIVARWVWPHFSPYLREGAKPEAIKQYIQVLVRQLILADLWRQGTKEEATNHIVDNLGNFKQQAIEYLKAQKTLPVKPLVQIEPQTLERT